MSADTPATTPAPASRVELLLAEIRDAISSPVRRPPRLLSAEEARAYLHVGAYVWRGIVDRGEVPEVRPIPAHAMPYGEGEQRTAPGTVRYDIRDLDAWIDSHKRARGA
jgi:hypothetical protein